MIVIARPHIKRSMKAFVEATQIPEDFLKGNLLVSMEGQERVVIENFKGISSYTEQEIRLVANRRKICVAGEKLRIDNFTKEEIVISGRICKLEYL